MRKRVVSIIAWPLRFLRRLLGLLLAPLRKRDKAVKPAKPHRRKQAKLDKPGRKARRNPLAAASKKLAAAFGKLAAAFRKLAGLRGKPRIAAVAILGVVVVVVVLALRPGPNAEKDVRATLDRYATATRHKDYQTLCDSLFSKDIKSGLVSVGLPCEVALSSSTLKDLRSPTLTVLGVEVSGDQAAAKVRTSAAGEVPSVDTIKLVRENGAWRVASLSEPGAQPTGSGLP